MPGPVPRGGADPPLPNSHPRFPGDASLPLAAFVSPAKTERALASTQCFSLSVMIPASRRQLALKDMKDAEGASLIGKISSRFTGDFMALTTDRSLLLAQDGLGAAAKMPATASSCHLYFGVVSLARSQSRSIGCKADVECTSRSARLWPPSLLWRKPHKPAQAGYRLEWTMDGRSVLVRAALVASERSR
jgi:hypothetical protein